MLDIKPVLKDNYTLDSWYKLGTRASEVVTGEVWIQATYHASRVRHLLLSLSTQADRRLIIEQAPLEARRL